MTNIVVVICVRWCAHRSVIPPSMPTSPLFNQFGFLQRFELVWNCFIYTLDTRSKYIDYVMRPGFSLSEDEVTNKR